MLSTEHKHPIFLKSLFGVASILSFGLYMTFRGVKEKKDFIHNHGQITYYEDTYPEISRPSGKYKYLVIDSYKKPFELLVPSKKSESYIYNFSEIKTGDVIDVYFDENEHAADKRTNMSVFMI